MFFFFFFLFSMCSLEPITINLSILPPEAAPATSPSSLCTLRYKSPQLSVQCWKSKTCGRVSECQRCFRAFVGRELMNDWTEKSLQLHNEDAVGQIKKIRVRFHSRSLSAVNLSLFGLIYFNQYACSALPKAFPNEFCTQIYLDWYGMKYGMKTSNQYTLKLIPLIFLPIFSSPWSDFSHFPFSEMVRMI